MELSKILFFVHMAHLWNFPCSHNHSVIIF
jgi:hypothetical protein